MGEAEITFIIVVFALLAIAGMTWALLGGRKK